MKSTQPQALFGTCCYRLSYCDIYWLDLLWFWGNIMRGTSADDGRGSSPPHTHTHPCMALVVTSIKLSSKSPSLISSSDRLYVCALEICKTNSLLLSSHPAIRASLYWSSYLLKERVPSDSLRKKLHVFFIIHLYHHCLNVVCAYRQHCGGFQTWKWAVA